MQRGTCAGTTNFASAGTYWVVCNAYSGTIGSSPKCTGNPIVPSGWYDCGSSSRRQVTVSTPPLTCPTNFSVSCNSAGTQATIDWDDLSGASGYVLRVNKDPQNDWMGVGDQWKEPVSSSQVLNITPSSNYVYDVQGKNQVKHILIQAPDVHFLYLIAQRQLLPQMFHHAM